MSFRSIDCNDYRVLTVTDAFVSGAGFDVDHSHYQDTGYNRRDRTDQPYSIAGGVREPCPRALEQRSSFPAPKTNKDCIERVLDKDFDLEKSRFGRDEPWTNI